MAAATFSDRSVVTRLDRDALKEFQLTRLNGLLAEILPHNTFYQHKLAGHPTNLQSLDQLASLPFTIKEELQPQADAEPFAFNRTYPVDQYVRCHQTSGTHGRPLVVLDTADDWRWWIDAWQYVLDAADVRSTDRALLAFSFGPFIGFWSAFDALIARGTLVIPGGGLSTLGRLEMLRCTKATVLLCTPTYALHLAEVAAEHKINLKHLSIKKIIVAGEPGGSVAATRERIESAWGAQLIDHAGATEVGPWGFADAAGRGLHVNEAHFIPEFLSTETGHPAQPGELSHLILTCLGRSGSPILRYRTGDIVRPTWPTDSACRFVFLEGGIVGRDDDMMIVRGMNVYPSAIEHILFSFPEVVEYRLTARKHGAMDELLIEVEDRLEKPARIAQELQLRLGLKIESRTVPPLSLPRFEGKARRFVDERNRP
ncbi:MAG TPA: AMP-binding protein [Lacipirellulaceae bacterium]|jgi:phenylacetate-CoA ligase|nr:AMP-binding protein [Lacipirellulaceae bacterium]